VAELHGFIRGELGRFLGQAEASGLRILYGGSVKPANASELLFVPDVNGRSSAAQAEGRRFLCDSVRLCRKGCG